jgi:hypothetical protein
MGLIVSMCWIALAMTIAGTLLVRFAATRKTGVIVRWLGFAAYVLGFIGVIVIYLDMNRGGDLLLLGFVLIAITTGIPLVTCSVIFYKLFRARKATAVEPA